MLYDTSTSINSKIRTEYGVYNCKRGCLFFCPSWILITVSVQANNSGSVGLTADAVDGTLDNVAGKPVVDCVLACVVQDMVELEPEAVLPVVVHPVGRRLRLMIRRSLVHGYRLR